MIECDFCFHHCRLKEGEIGFCRSRQNQGGLNISLTYGKISSMALDPIEKKPLAHFYPGSMILSLGSMGCNLRCPFCQNHSISMASLDDQTSQSFAPEAAVELALKLKAKGNIGIAFTYNEPLINFEYVLDTSKQAHKFGLKTVLVTNGTIEPKKLQLLLPTIDALNIDLKGFTQAFYASIQGDLECVKTNIIVAHQSCHVEITTLIIPGQNDQDEQMEAEAKWLASIDPNLTLHLTRFFPHYKMDKEKPTPISTLIRLKSIAEKYLNHVYLGNI